MDENQRQGVDTDSYDEKTKARLVRHTFPSIGIRPVPDISAPELLAILKAIEKRGTVDMAHRVQQHCGAVLRYAIASRL